jgi:protein phosphatase
MLTNIILTFKLKSSLSLQNMHLSHISVSETGLRRSNNEDAVIFVEPEKPWLTQSMGVLAVVSDGMGGYERGEKASAMVVDILNKSYYRELGQPLENLRRAAIEVNNAVAIEAKISGQRMGATCTAVVICDDQLHFMHIGDSRAYIYTGDELHQCTNDHTAANELAHSQGMRHSDQTMIFNPHALTKAMGMKFSNECQADIFSRKNNLQKGDRILLCSDGLYIHVNDEDLRTALNPKKSLKQVTDQLVKWVMKRGALDNFTFLLIEFD